MKDIQLIQYFSHVHCDWTLKAKIRLSVKLICDSLHFYALLVHCCFLSIHSSLCVRVEILFWLGQLVMGSSISFCAIISVTYLKLFFFKLNFVLFCFCNWVKKRVFLLYIIFVSIFYSTEICSICAKQRCLSNHHLFDWVDCILWNGPEINVRCLEFNHHRTIYGHSVAIITHQLSWVNIISIH